MKRKIKASQLLLLKKEIAHWKEAELISSEQAESLLDQYESKSRSSSIQMLLLIGAILIGAGVLSFIASNWSGLSNPVRFILLFFGVLLSFGFGWNLSFTYPKTARSLYYLGVFLYGASIFLIGQMFHLGFDIHPAFLLWSLGIFPLSLYLRDRFLFLFSHLLMGIYMYISFDNSDWLYLWLIPIFILLSYWLNLHRFRHSQALFAGINVLAIMYLFMLFFQNSWDVRWLIGLIFLLGLSFTWHPFPAYQSIQRKQGAIYYGITGLMMTFPRFWDFLPAKALYTLFSIGFAILFMLLILVRLRQSDLSAILILCVLILRFYIDFSYDFLPKSLFFILGGTVLIGFGYWFEKRRKGEGKNDEKMA